MMFNSYKSLPLFLGGIFLIYVAALDESLFDFILDNTVQNRITVTIATVVASALPMFFAIGFIKQSVLSRWQTIYQYERLLEKDAFWILTIILLASIMIIKITEGVHIISMMVLVASVAFSAYLIIHRFANK